AWREQEQRADAHAGRQHPLVDGDLLASEPEHERIGEQQQQSAQANAQLKLPIQPVRSFGHGLFCHSLVRTASKMRAPPHEAKHPRPGSPTSSRFGANREPGCRKAGGAPGPPLLLATPDRSPARRGGDQSPCSARNASSLASSQTSTPSSVALSSLEPAASPATTK